MKKLLVPIITLSLLVAIMLPIKENNTLAILQYIPNFSFEEVNENGNLIGWSKFSSNTVMNIDKDIYNSGKQSLRIDDNSSSFSMGAISNKIKIIPGESYKAFAKTDSSSGQIYLRFYDSNDKYISQTLAGTKSRLGWNTVEVTGKAPSNAQYARILLYSHGALTGTIHYDSVNFQRILENYSFEKNSSSPIEGWTKTWGSGAAINNSISYIGENSAKIYDTSRSSPGGLESNKFKVEEGETYSASAKIYTDTSAQLYIRFHDSDGNLIGSKATTYDGKLNEWNTIKVTGTAPSDTRSASIIIYTTGYDTGSAYFDEIYFEKAEKLQLTGELDSNELVSYSISISEGGTLDLVDLHDSNVDYILYNIEEQKNYISGQYIPPGDYEFSIQSAQKESTGYKFVFSGIKIDFNTTSTTLPILDVTNPKNEKKYLPSDSKNAVVKGYTDSPTEVTQYKLNPLKVEGNFSENINIGFGKNDVSFTSVNSANNKVIKKYDVISPGVKRISNTESSVISDVALELNKFHLLNNTVIIINDGDLENHFGTLPLSYFETAPILLSNVNSLYSETENAIATLKPKNAILLGGTEKLSSNIEYQLGTLGIENIERISWSTPRELSKAIAERMLKPESSQLIVVNENSYVDAAIASSYASRSMIPIIYNAQDSISSELQTILNTFTNINEIVIVGDENKISLTVENSLKNYSKVTRITGSNYEKLNLKFNNHHDFQNSLNTIVRATNKHQLFAAAEMSIFRNGTLLISDNADSSQNLSRFLSNYGGINIYFFGTTSQLSENFSNSQEQRIGQMFP